MTRHERSHMESLDKWSDFFQKHGGWVVASIGLLATLYRRFFAFLRALRFNYYFSEQNNGDAQKLAKLLSSLQREQSITAIRLRITEQFLEVGIFECDMEGKCTGVNSEFLDKFGLHEKEALGYGWLAGVIDEHRDRVFEKWKKCVETGIPYRDRYRIQAQGRIKNVHAFAHPLKKNGILVGFIGHVQERNEQ